MRKYEPAMYKCLKCSFEWEEEYLRHEDRYPGATLCRNCGHFYVKWVNYEKLFGKKK